MDNNATEEESLFDYVIVGKRLSNQDPKDIKLNHIYKNLSNIDDPTDKKLKKRYYTSDFDPSFISFLMGLVEGDTAKLSDIIFPLEKQSKTKAEDMFISESPASNNIMERSNEILLKIAEYYKDPTAKEEKTKNKLSEEDTMASLKLFRVIFAMSRDKFSMSLHEKNREEILNELVNDFKEQFLLRIENFTSDAAVQDKIAQFTFGIMSWDLKLILKGSFSEKTIHQFTLWFSLIGIKHFKNLFPKYEVHQEFISYCSKNFLRYVCTELEIEEYENLFKSNKTKSPPDDIFESVEKRFVDKKAELEIQIEEICEIIQKNKNDEYSWPQIIFHSFENLEEFNPKIKHHTDGKKSAPQLKASHLVQGFLSGQILITLADTILNRLDTVNNIIIKKVNMKLSKGGGDIEGSSLGDNLKNLKNFSVEKSTIFLREFIKCISIVSLFHDKDLLETSKKKALKVQKPKKSKETKKPKLQAAEMETMDTVDNEKLFDSFIEVFSNFLKCFENDMLYEMEPLFNVLMITVVFYLVLINDELRKLSIYNQCLVMLVKEFSVKIPSKISKLNDEEKSISAAIGGIILGLKPESLKDGAIVQKLDKNQLFNEFFKKFVSVGLPGLSDTKFNLESIKNLLQLISMVRTDYVSNIKSPARLEEILKNFLSVLELLFPGFNPELALSLVGLAFGNFDKIKIILTNYFISNSQIQAEKLAAEKLATEKLSFVKLAADKLAADKLAAKMLTGKKPAIDNDDDEIPEEPGQNEKNLPNITEIKMGVIEKESEIDTKNKINEALNEQKKKYLDKVNSIFTYMQEIQGMLDFSSLKVKLPSNSPEQAASISAADPEQWQAILKKIQNGEVRPDDLFHILNKVGGGTGKISPKQFKILADRLGIKLTDHRINEIFAKVKGGAGGGKLELNAKEFQKSIVYLMEKCLETALEILGLTMEQLGILLIQLILILILLLIFIFVGIKAFALGGTFGSVINSSFPASKFSLLLKN